MSSNNNNSSNNANSATTTPAASQVESDANATAADAAAPTTNETQGLESKNEAHIEIFEELMDLYYDASRRGDFERRSFECWMKYKDYPDKHDLHRMFDLIKELVAGLEKVCRMAKKAEPQLLMIKQYYREDEPDEDPDLVEEEVQ